MEVTKINSWTRSSKGLHCHDLHKRSQMYKKYTATSYEEFQSHRKHTAALHLKLYYLKLMPLFTNVLMFKFTFLKKLQYKFLWLSWAAYGPCGCLTCFYHACAPHPWEHDSSFLCLIVPKCTGQGCQTYNYCSKVNLSEQF